MKKTLLVAALMVLCFSGISNAELLYSDPDNCFFGTRNGVLNSKTWSINIGPANPAELSVRLLMI